MRRDPMKPLFLILPILLLSACSQTEPTQAKQEPAAPPERRTESRTYWSAKTELFVEFPELVQGEESRFAIHLTRLSDFKPVPAGRSEVKVLYADGTTESFATDAPSKAGIFGVTVKPTHPGESTLEIRLISPALSDAHKLEHVTVYRTVAEAPTGEEKATEETLAFLKEQQWALDFGTELAKPAMLRESIVVPAEVTPRSGGEVAVTAPLAGRLNIDTPIILGTRVTQGQTLASVIPPTSVPNDRAALDLAKAEADAALDYAHRDRERAARLVDAGAAPAKRLDEARTAERTAEARRNAAEERIRQFDATRNAEGSGSTAYVVKAPITGQIVEVTASSGMNLKGGEPLFRILDTERVYVSAIVPEADYPNIRTLTGAELEIPGLAQPRPAGRLISIGKVVDPATRTFPIVYEATNTDARIAINQTVTIRLFLSNATRGTTVPESALVDDGGRPVVFIQREGESFVRRPVDVGRRQAGIVEITNGVEPGDRIVTKGAYLIRLSALSTQIPAHGHVH